MDIQQKITSFAILEGGWIMWLLVGLSIGGLSVFLQRAFILISDRRRQRRSAARPRVPARAAAAQGLAILSQSCCGA